LVIELVYSNIHGQFFKTVYENEIYYLNVDSRNNDKDKLVFWADAPMLQDDETFEVVLSNPVYSHLEIKLLSNIEAVDYINEYKNAD